MNRHEQERRREMRRGQKALVLGFGLTLVGGLVYNNLFSSAPQNTGLTQINRFVPQLPEQTPWVADGTTEYRVEVISNNDIRDSVQKPIVQELPEAPTYSENRVPSNHCSRYVRLAAKDLFNIKYPKADTWDLRDKVEIKTFKAKNRKDLEALADKGILTPGDIMAVYNPSSGYNSDPRTKKAGYTHVLIYLGSEGNEFYFADQFGSKTRTKISLSEIEKRGLKPIEILERK